MAVNDTVELAVIGVVGGEQHVHTLHFRFQTLNATDAGLVADFIANPLGTYRNIFYNADTPAERVVARQVCGGVPLRSPAESAPASPGGTRALTTERAPGWVSVVNSVRTALAGRSRRGRFYIGGMAEYDVTGNYLSNANGSHAIAIPLYSAALIARYELVSGASADYKLVVHSRKLAAVAGSQCQNTSTPVNAILMRQLLGSTRSRRPGSGS